MEFSGRDIILIVGGLFLLAKATWEIHGRLEGDEHQRDAGRVSSVTGAIIQIMLLDIIFSLDSVITAVGMVNEIPVMIAAIVIAVLVMLVSSGYVIRILDQHPSLKILALVVPSAHRRDARRGRVRPAHRQGLHLLRDGVRGVRGSDQHPRDPPVGAPLQLHDPYHEKEPPGGGANPPKPSDDDPAPGAAPA